jgi:hypothetical protein
MNALLAILSAPSAISTVDALGETVVAAAAPFVDVFRSLLDAQDEAAEAAPIELEVEDDNVNAPSEDGPGWLASVLWRPDGV